MTGHQDGPVRSNESNQISFLTFLKQFGNWTMWEMKSNSSYFTTLVNSSQLDQISLTIPFFLDNAHSGLIWWLEVKDNFCITAGSDGYVKVIDIETGKITKSIKTNQRSIWAVDLDPINDIAISGSDDGTVSVWKLSTGEPIKALKIFNSIYDINLLPNLKEILIASTDVRKTQIFH